MNGSQKRKINVRRVGVIWGILAVALCILALVAITVGSAGYSIAEILRALLSHEKSTRSLCSICGFQGSSWRC